MMKTRMNFGGLFIMYSTIALYCLPLMINAGDASIRSQSNANAFITRSKSWDVKSGTIYDVVHKTSDFSRRIYKWNELDHVIPRGGAIPMRRGSGVTCTTENVGEPSALRSRIKYGLVTVSAMLIILYSDVLVSNSGEMFSHARAAFDIEKFKANLIVTLRDVNDMGIAGVFLFVAGLTIWEGFGMTTAFVETAAGMAFDLKKAIVFSFAGKFGGALLAFMVGRKLLFEKVKKMSEGNDIFPLVEESIKNNPIGIAYMVRYFPFPELMKNLGLSITSISMTSFAIASFIQQLPFTVLWCLVGAETANALDPTAGPSNKILQACVFLVAVVGLVGGPAILALYLSSLKKKE